MGKLSNAAVALIVVIALYFMLFWGYDGLRILTSPSYGLDEVWRSQFIFAIGRLFGLGPIGLIKLAAFFGALKLAVACICAMHIADRIRCWTRGEANSEILDAGLTLEVVISIASVGPASWSYSADLMREHTYQLLFAALATGLCIFSAAMRGQRNCPDRPEIVVDAAATQVLRAFTSDGIRLAPPVRPKAHQCFIVWPRYFCWSLRFGLTWLIAHECLTLVIEKFDAVSHALSSM